MIMVKVPTTPENQGIGLIRALEKSQVPLTDISLIVHGTTVATNTLIQRNGSTCGLITTKGFRDILELRRGDRPRVYGLKGDFEPLVPREWRMEVEERITSEGDILKEIDESEIVEVGKRLQEAGVEAVVVSFLHAYANPAHEEKAKKILKTFWFNDYVLASSEILPIPGEFERTSTAVIHAYVQPLIHRYLDGIDQELQAHQFRGRMVLMNSYGGIMSPAEVKRSPASTILSGPAGGVIATCHLAEQTGYKNLLSCDIGGTSCDVSVIVDGTPALVDGKDLDFGTPFYLPMLDINTIGAGGGSIAWIDNSGYLWVGPQSAGAKPGPACYGRRGVKPTVTDANLILGRMNPDSPILKSSGITLCPQLAKEAIKNQVATILGIQLEEAAFAILEIVNQNMAGLLRNLTISRGHNPRDFVLVAFGGAGPLHAAFLAQEVGISTVLVPPYSGAFSAYGCMIAENKQILEQTLYSLISTDTVETLPHNFLTHLNQARERMQNEDLSLERLRALCEVEMAYQGQAHGIWVPYREVGSEQWGSEKQIEKSEKVDKETLIQRFEEAYRKYFGGVISEFPVIIKRLRTTVLCSRPEENRRMDLETTNPLITIPDVPMKSKRSVYFQGHFIETPVYERSLLVGGTSLLGPVLIEQEDSTTVVPPEVHVEVDRYRNLILTCY